MPRTEVVTLTNMCMVYDGDRVLVQNKVDDSYSGVTFPGGHVEKGEAFSDSVIREVFEETGLTVLSPVLCGIKDWYEDDGSRYVVLLYKTDKFTGELSSSDEGEVFWTDLPLAQDMDDLLKVFRNDGLSEFHYYKDNGVWRYWLR